MHYLLLSFSPSIYAYNPGKSHPVGNAAKQQQHTSEMKHINPTFISKPQSIKQNDTSLQEEPHQHSNRQRTPRQLETHSRALRSIAGEWYSRVRPIDAGTAVCECVGSAWGWDGGVLEEKDDVSGGCSVA